MPASTSPLTVVVPVLDEQDSLRQLRERIAEVATENGLEIEVVFVDDGSRDDSWRIEKELSETVAGTRAIRLRRNFGKAAALAAGFAAVNHPIVITMDADLQDDPKEIPRFLAAMDQGLDVVSGWKQVRHDPWHKTLPSRVFNAMVGRLTGVKIHDHNCGFKAYRREIFDEVKLYGELHRFVPVLAAARGWKVGEIVVEHHARPFGKSKYGAGRLIKGFLDLMTIYFITGYAQRPLHLMGTVGLVSFLGGLCGLTYLSIAWCVTRLVERFEVLHLHEKAIFYYCILAILFGAQLVVAGLLAEMLAAVVRPSNKPYSIAEKAGCFDESKD
jgi:glycosyltransferase involved in cell wall biosynthesis